MVRRMKSNCYIKRGWMRGARKQNKRPRTISFLKSDSNCEARNTLVEAPADQPAEANASVSMLKRERMVLGWPKRCKLAHAFLWEYS